MGPDPGGAPGGAGGAVGAPMKYRFKTHSVPLETLLDRARKGALQLPDFQTGWVWDDDPIRRLLVSISKSYPIGAIITLEAGKTDFRALPLQGAELTTPQSKPRYLLLDGQQRLTSLLLALTSKDPVPTGTNGPRRWYYAKIDAATGRLPDGDDGIVVSVPGDRCIREDFGRRIVTDLRTIEDEVRSGMFPLNIVFDRKSIMRWQQAYVQQDADPTRNLLSEWEEIDASILTPFEGYAIPEIRLARDTPIDADWKDHFFVTIYTVMTSVPTPCAATTSARSFAPASSGSCARSKVQRASQ